MPGKRRFGRVREQRGGGFVSGPPKVNQPMPDRKPFAVPMADRWRPQFSARSGTDMARMRSGPSGWSSMRTTGAHDNRTTSAASKGCLRSYLAPVVRPLLYQLLHRADAEVSEPLT